MKRLLVVALLLLGTVRGEAASGRSEFLANLGQGISKKADERYQSRWTLADWFETQRKTRLQDQWLAGNKKDDLYEFYVGGQTGASTISNDAVEASIHPRRNQALAGAYATLAGLEGRYFDMAGSNDSESAYNTYGWEGLLGLRPLGDSLQNTNVTLFYGFVFRDEAGGESVQNSTAKARLTFYLTKAVGLEGYYQWIFKATSNQSSEIEGSAAHGELFLDFSLLRIYGAYSQDTRTRVANVTGVKTERQRRSIDVGLKIFF